VERECHLLSCSWGAEPPRFERGLVTQRLAWVVLGRQRRAEGGGGGAESSPAVHLRRGSNVAFRQNARVVGRRRCARYVVPWT